MTFINREKLIALGLVTATVSTNVYARGIRISDSSSSTSSSSTSSSSVPPRRSGGVIPSFSTGGGVSPVHTSGGGSPITVDPDLLGGGSPITIDPDLLSGGLGGKNPRLPHGIGSVLSSLEKLNGGFSNIVSAQNNLIDGNYYSADRACLKVEQNAPQGKWIDDASIDAFRDPTYEAEFKTKQMIASMPADLAQKFKQKGPTIMDRGNPCNDTVQKQMCRALLGRSIIDERQANYSPVGEQPVLDSETQLSRDKAEEELNGAIETKDEETTVGETVSGPTSSTQDKTVFLLIMIDKALAKGDKKGAQGAIALLREINPSAAYALDCLGVMTFGQKDKDSRLPISKDPEIGPITGLDYSDDAAHENPVVTGVARELGWEAVKAGVVKLVDSGIEAVTGSKFFETEANRREKMKQEYKDYLACKQAGGAGCDQAWEDGALMDKRGKEGKNIFTGEPLKKNDGTPGSPETPLPPLDSNPLPNDDDSNRGPVIGPSPSGTPEHPVQPDIAAGKSPIEKLGLSKKDREEIIKTRDPNATENYCKQVVQDFRNIKNKELTMTPVQFAGDNFAQTTGRIAGMSGGVMVFDQWGKDFWTEMNDFSSHLPGAQSKENSCNAADPVEPMPE